MKMTIKTRLLFYNILLILLSSCLVLVIIKYMTDKSSDLLYNVASITIDENAYEVEKILSTNSPYQIMEINLKKFNYELYVYENNELVYGEENNSLNQLVEKYIMRRNDVKTLFVDNSTTVMRTDDNTIYLAMHKKFSKESIAFFPNSHNPFQKLLMKIVGMVLVCLIVMLFFAILLSNKILKRVMNPVKLLKEGAERVQDGNYDKKIIYEKNDEFSSVINNFNDMQESLYEKTEKAKSYELAKKEMISGISHDIRTPLTVVKGNIKGIQDGVASTKEKRDKYLSIAYNRVLDIEDLLNRLFDTFNYETGEIKLNKEKVNLVDFINEIIITNENVINKTIKIETDYENDTIIADIDKLQFKRIFDNLINNAIKHNKDKENLKIDIKLFKNKGNVKIIFKDNGKGVKKENINHIFNEFFKEDESRNNDKSGSGLGLFIVSKIIESHGGTIKATNKKGLCFEIILESD